MSTSTTVFKTGYLIRAVADGESEGPSGPGKSYTFVMSTESRDSYGDIVKQNWDLRQFKKNPIGLWRHSTEYPIGTWSNVKVANGVLQGTFTFASPGTTECVDEVAALVEQQIVRMVSVGFNSLSATPIDPKNPWDGFILDDNVLRECSIVPLGACDEAMMSKHIKTADKLLRKALLSESDERATPGSAYSQLKSQASGPTTKPQTTTKRSTTMSLADKIKAKQQHIVKVKDQIAAITNSLDDTGAMSDDQSDEINRLAGELQQHNKGLDSLELLERTMAEASGGANSGQQDQQKPVPRIEVKSCTPGSMKASNALACVIKGLATNRQPLDIVREEFQGRDLPEVELLVRAATAPAVSGTAAWGGNLIQETWGPLVETMYGMTIYGKVPGERINLEGKVNMPTEGASGALAGDFIAENGVFPVKVGAIGTTSLQPHTLGVISAFSKELMRRSIPSIQGIIQNKILKDTAEVVDTRFLDSVARTAGSRPAGLANTTETGNANVNGATGTTKATVAEILADVEALLGRVWAVKGNGGVWLMNPAQRLALANKQHGVTGLFTFRDEIARGLFNGYPILESTNVTAGTVAFIADGSMMFGTELLPYFEQSDQATLHFDTAPASISAVASTNTVAAPVLSLFQQNLVAVKGVWTLDWRIVRPGAVQVLTGATVW